MINHARTLLLNVSPQKNQRQDAGYEYMSAAFWPSTLSPALAAVYKILFGRQPDMYFLNLRARELLTYVHQTELADYVYKLDPRVTYWPTTDAAFFENAKATLVVTQTVGPPLPLNWGGGFVASNSLGVTTKQFEITASNTDAIYISIRDLNSLTAPQVTLLPDPMQPPTIPLPETNLQFKFNPQVTTEVYATLTELEQLLILEQYDAEIGLGLDPAVIVQPQPPAMPFKERRPILRMTGQSLPQGVDTAKWLVTARANPQPAITSVLPVLEILGEPLFLELFGVAPVEPYATFKNLWFDHPLSAYRLAGLVLAFIYRAEELRKANDG